MRLSHLVPGIATLAAAVLLLVASPVAAAPAGDPDKDGP